MEGCSDPAILFQYPTSSNSSLHAILCQLGPCSTAAALDTAAVSLDLKSELQLTEDLGRLADMKPSKRRVGRARNIPAQALFTFPASANCL